MEFQYYIPTKILFGKGQLRKLHQQTLPGKKALIVITAGLSVRKHGYLRALQEQLSMAQVSFVLYDKILPNPIKEHVMEGAEYAKKTGCDFVIGLGGGSAIDAAKAIAIMAANPGDLWDYLKGGTAKGMPLTAVPLPIVAITTTAGTGTEADPWLVITNTQTQEKIGFGCDGTYPVLSIVDPELMCSVPPLLTAFQGFDALFHSTEGYLNPGHTPVSDAYAVKSMELIYRSLETAVKDGMNLDARTDVALANTLAGMVQSTSNSISAHAIAHGMGGLKPELPHGAGLILISPAYYAHLAQKPSCRSRMIAMAKVLGVTDCTDPMDFVSALKNLIKCCGVSQLKMSDYGFTKEELPAIQRLARQTGERLFLADPEPLSYEEVQTILEESYQ